MHAIIYGMKPSGSFGPTTQKALLLLSAGVGLLIAPYPNQKFRILRQAKSQWEEIEQRALYRAINNLYKNKLIDGKENKDGTVTLRLNENGRIKALTHDLENMQIPEMKRWDGKWRVILFDIPERHKKARNAVAKLLKNMGCHPFQKSVFVHPYECKSEADFVIEFFALRPYVRYIVANEIDNELHLKKLFGLK